MGLIGFIDPSHDELGKAKWGRKPRWFSIDELLEESITRSGKWSPWSFELIQAVLMHHQERDYVSTSMLTGGCMRGNVLERRVDYIDDLNQRYAAIRGSLVHRTMELAARPGALAEWRFFAKWNDTEFSCSPDIIVPDQGILNDYKTTENPPSFGYAYVHHKEQVQVNRWVVNHAVRWLGPGGVDMDIPVDPRSIKFKECGVVYLGPKGPKTIVIEKKQKWTSPNGNAIEAPRPYVWSDKEVESWLAPRIEAVEMALAAYPEWPDGLEEYEGWAGPKSWACPGVPLCYLPNCLAKRYPDGFVW